MYSAKMKRKDYGSSDSESIAKRRRCHDKVCSNK